MLGAGRTRRDPALIAYPGIAPATCCRGRRRRRRCCRRRRRLRLVSPQVVVRTSLWRWRHRQERARRVRGWVRMKRTAANPNQHTWTYYMPTTYALGPSTCAIAAAAHGDCSTTDGRATQLRLVGATPAAHAPQAQHNTHRCSITAASSPRVGKRVGRGGAGARGRFLTGRYRRSRKCRKRCRKWCRKRRCWRRTMSIVCSCLCGNCLLKGTCCRCC